MPVGGKTPDDRFLLSPFGYLRSEEPFGDHVEIVFAVAVALGALSLMPFKELIILSSCRVILIRGSATLGASAMASPEF